MELSSFIAGFEDLPRHVKEHVREYVESLVNKHKKRHEKDKENDSFTFDWENGLSDLKDISSVELQHKANRLR
ncbi:MAG: DUF2281 domain-containing protein [Bacteroidales bacterium]|nr:DUF2281 domain-containing protein [Bacteroidales bacterium]